MGAIYWARFAKVYYANTRPMQQEIVSTIRLSFDQLVCAGYA